MALARASVLGAATRLAGSAATAGVVQAAAASKAKTDAAEARRDRSMENPLYWDANENARHRDGGHYGFR
jgi:hypothetical protein